MEIKAEEIEEFKQIYYAETGVELSDDDAIKKARTLLALIKFATDPMPQVEGPGADKN